MANLPSAAMTAARDRLTGPELAAATLRWLPIVGFVAAAVITAALLAQYIHAMATTSLWVDEYYTQSQFATKGPWIAWTDYHVPNNHILFSIANSIWPDSIAHEPVPARLLSFLAVIAAFAMLGWFAASEKAWGGGALALLLLADIQTLDLTLQARGYGFAMLAAIVQAVATARYLSDAARGWLVTAAAAAFVGVATLPVFVLLAAPLAIGLLVLRPRREVIVALVLAGIAGFVFYLPTAAQLVSVASTYAYEWGARYTTMASVVETYQYVLQDGALGIAAGAATATVTVAAMLRGTPPRRGFLVLALVSLVVFSASCLAMTTPRVRTTQFAAAVLPVILVAASGTAGLGPRRLWVAGNLLLLAVAVPQAVDATARLRNLDFTPIEAWREAAAIVDAIAPSLTPVHATFRPVQLAVYLDGSQRIVETFDEAAFRRGDLVVVDGSFREPKRFAGAEHAPGALDVLVPQRRGKWQVVSYVPESVPLAVQAAGAEADAVGTVADGDVRSGWRGRPGTALTLAPQAACDRLILLGTRGGFADTIDVRLGKARDNPPLADRIFRFDRLAVVNLHGLAAASIDVAPRRSDGRLAIAEAWCVPPRDSPRPGSPSGTEPPELVIEPPRTRLPQGTSSVDGPIGEPLAPR